jgi:hypothetical protein
VSRDPQRAAPDPEPGGEPPASGSVQPTRGGVVTGFALVGLVLGWLLRPASLRLDGTAPTVGWTPVLSLLFVAAVVAVVAWSTNRSLQRRRERMEPHRAVNRLVLAKSCALAGALAAGGYLGYALSWLGLTDVELARQRATHALVGGVSGALLVVAALLLERACRVSGEDR